MARNKTAEKGRFILVGIANTTIDLGTLFALTSVGLPIITANIISTTLAFTFSFFANKTFTFRAAGGDLRRQILLFILVTLFALWVIQTVVIQTLTPLFIANGLSSDTALLIAKLLAIIITLIWNYTMYSHVVFKNKEK